MDTRKAWRPPAAVKAILHATVMEASGRAVSAYGSAVIDAYPFYIGMRSSWEGAVRAGETQRVDVVQVAPDGSPAAEGPGAGAAGGGGVRGSGAGLAGLSLLLLIAVFLALAVGSLHHDQGHVIVLGHASRERQQVAADPVDNSRRAAARGLHRRALEMVQAPFLVFRVQGLGYAVGVENP